MQAQKRPARRPGMTAAPGPAPLAPRAPRPYLRGSEAAPTAAAAAAAGTAAGRPGGAGCALSSGCGRPCRRGAGRGARGRTGARGTAGAADSAGTAQLQEVMGSRRRPVLFVAVALWQGSAGALAHHGREGSTLARGAARTPLGSLALASSNSFSPPPRRRRPATRSPWALRSSEVLRQPRGRGVRTSPGAPCTFLARSSLPLSWKAPAEAVDPHCPQQIRARRWPRPGRPPPPTGRCGRGGGDSGRVAATEGLARGGSGRGAGAAPRFFGARARMGEGAGLGAPQPTLVPSSSRPGARTWQSPGKQSGGAPSWIALG